MKRISLTIVFTNCTSCRTNSCRFRGVSGRSSSPRSTSESRRRRRSGRSLNENDKGGLKHGDHKNGNRAL
nr:MAG TPA: hypothetical protein [Caudoviricetes sp.]